jgi:hypothetical protein
VELVLYEAIEREDGQWSTLGTRGQTTTDERGIYLFQAATGVRYIVATKARDQHGKQQVIHRTPQPTTKANYRVPNVDLADLHRKPH